MKYRTVVIILALMLSFIPLSIAEDDPPTPPPGPLQDDTWIESYIVNPPWSYFDSSLYFWCIYFDSENRTIDSASIFIDNISYDLWENTTNTSIENPKIGKNFIYHADGPWERRVYEFYFQITTGLTITNSSMGYFEIVNRPPYMLEPPPVEMYVDEEFEWEGRAHDPDMDDLTWTWISNITESSEWEFIPDNTTVKFKIKCESPFVGWINISVSDNYTYDFWNFTLTCYTVGGKGEPVPPRSGVGKTPYRLTGISDGSFLSDDPPKPLIAQVWYWLGAVDDDWDDPGNWNPLSLMDYPKDADDLVFINDGVTDDVTIQDGVNSVLTIGELVVNNTYTGTMTSALDLVVDSSGTESGDITLGGGTWDWDSFDVNMDGDWLNTGTTISNPARFTVQGAQVQSITSNGEAFNQVTVDNVASTIYYVMDDTEIFDLTILSAGTFEIDSVSEGATLTLAFTDSANCGFISTTSGTLLLQGDATPFTPTLTTADAAPPPTNWWSGYMNGLPTITMAWTDIGYGQNFKAGGTWDVDHTTWDDMRGGYYNPTIQVGSTVNAFNDVTIGSNVAHGTNFDTVNYATIDNYVSSAITTSLYARDSDIELTDSNFDYSKAVYRFTGTIVSVNHNDVANAWGIGTAAAHDHLKSAITNKHASGDDVRVYSGKYVLDENGAADTVRVDSGATFQIGQDTPTASRTLTFDDVAGAGFDTNSAGSIVGSGTNTWEQYITSAATPPGTYWQCNLDVGNPDFTFDYTTLSYGTRCRSTGTWDIDHSTFDNFFNGQYVVTIMIGATITSFTHNTISNSALGLYARVGHTNYDNIVITMTTTDIRSRDVMSEFNNSNFDVTQIVLDVSGNIISATHNDVTDNYKIICTNADKTGITNDFTSSDNVEVVSNGCDFTMDEDAESTNYWAQANTVTRLNSGFTWTITGNANFTINGTVESSGIITYSGAQWFSFFINYNAYLYLNTSTVINSDIVISFPYTIGASNYGAVNELNISQPAGADTIINITQRDFSVKGSGTVLTFVANNSASVNTHYTVTNLSSGEAYNVDINGTTEYTIDAAGSQIGFSYLSEGERTIEITWTANITGGVAGEDGGPIPVIFAGFQTTITGDRVVSFDPSPSYATYEIIGFYWTFGDGNVSTLENPTHRYEFDSVQKEYSVTLTVTDKFHYTNMTVQKVTSSNWNFFIGVGLMLFIFVAAMIRTTIDKGTLQKRFKTWRSSISRRLSR